MLIQAQALAPTMKEPLLSRRISGRLALLGEFTTTGKDSTKLKHVKEYIEASVETATQCYHEGLKLMGNIYRFSSP